MAKFDATQLLNELEAGLLSAKLTQIMKETALGVAEHGKKGQVTLTFDFKRIGETMQLALSHKIGYKRPTKKGMAAGHDGDLTAVYCNGNGDLSIMPHNQTELFTKEKA
jgi:hypothetical protein